ncbi:L-lactate dehydrogenase [Eubacterium sp. 1001713B170207_170306_E7]|uniref:L-lactate dehydrogenase n=1 Tax=Eubacterium sp. 1001713B170207_170306_E7 TaxID=2787097 RepID=UPI00189963A9|nr:L-lactate dehydrogenase [Eubacterium sp. 1001713B170207_170306_E7]
MINRKVAIIGAGFTGASIAYALTMKDLADEIILIDQNKKVAQGEALDIRHGISFMGTAYIREGDYQDCKNCHLIIITAGRNRRPGETRLDLVDENLQIVKKVCDQIQPYYTNSVIMMITNPVDIITTFVTNYLKIPEGRVFSTGCLLDTSRLLSQVADYVGLKTETIRGFIAGEHGEGQVPVWSRFSVAGEPIEEYCANTGIIWNHAIKENIQERVRQMGATIIADKGRTHYGIATCVCALADAILNRRATVSCVSSVLKGEYGVSGIALSVPSIIDGNGVQKRLVEQWTSDEINQFRESAEHLKNQAQKINEDKK